MESERNDSADMQALFDQVAAQGAAAGSDPAARMLAGIGGLTRSLHDMLRELGYDRALEEATHAIPDARDRLSYVATMTEQAAQRALSATEVAKPIQDQMAAEAAALSEKWRRLLDRQLPVGEFRELVLATRGYLDAVPGRVGETNNQLLEIMMAQDFQDLTGQVIKKITAIIQNLEQQLVKMLVENTPVEKRSKEAESLMNGPVINPEGLAGVVTTQKQVDDLLDSLGF
jgi:chemotaxis protein CheZ